MEDFLRTEWEGGFLGTWDANDLVTLLHTWYYGDVTLVGKSTFSASHNEDGFASTLSAIKAKGLIMPCKTDLYFPVLISFRVSRSTGTDDGLSLRIASLRCR